MRVAGVIIKEGKILLMRRVKNNRDYFVFPGGGVEAGESQEEALAREIKEELSLDIKNPQKVFEFENQGIAEAYYLITEFTGTVELGGPEKERMNESNQYYPEWYNLIKASEFKNLLPREAVNRLRRLSQTHPSSEYYKAIAKKRMASGVLIFNEEGQLLLVKPSYKDHWSIPGGVTEADESPRQTAVRETREEIGINLGTYQLLGLDYIPAVEEVDESLQFIFYGGVLSDEEIKSIKIDQDEISDYKFANIDESLELLGGVGRKLAKRLPACLEALKNKTVAYLENGEVLVDLNCFKKI